MDYIDTWWESQKEEWKQEIEKTKELGTVDIETLDVMSTLLDGIKIRKRGTKRGGAPNGSKKSVQKQKQE